MGVDLHKTVGGPWIKYKQDANLGNSYCSYKNLHQANTVVSHRYRTRVESFFVGDMTLVQRVIDAHGRVRTP